MKIFRGPKTAEEILRTDDVSLKSFNEDLKPNDKVDFDINIDKYGERQSAACLSLDEEDFELIHDNYIKYLKAEVSRLRILLNNHRNAWENLHNLNENTYFYPEMEKEFIRMAKEQSYNVTNLQSLNNYGSMKKLTISDVMDIDGEISIPDAFNHLKLIISKYPDEVEKYVDYELDCRHLIYFQLYMLEIKMTEPDLANIIDKKHRNKKMTCSKLLSIIVSMIER